MGRVIRRCMGRGLLTGALLIALSPAAVFAQGGNGYLFKQPRVTLKIESGYGFQRAGSDIFDFVMDSLTLGRRDFDSPYIGGEFSVRATEKLDLAFSVGYQASSVQSEYLNFVEPPDLPINQVTELAMVPVTVGFKYYPLPRGRMLGRFAWVPRTISPFFGASVGAVSYRFEQYGDFVDYDTYEIFTDDFKSRDTGALLRVGAGVNVSLGQQFLFSLEGRYGWANARVQGDFIGFDRIDLSGLQVVGGLGVRF